LRNKAGCSAPTRIEAIGKTLLRTKASRSVATNALAVVDRIVLAL
jgi:hypothetical protein